MSRKRNLVVLLLACVWASLVVAPQAQADATFVVTSTADTEDGTCDSNCTLREAITAANAAEGTDEIDFALPGPGPHTIALSAELPPTDHVTIDGLSQAGASPTSPNVSLSGDPSVPEAISVAQTTIRGINLIGFAGFSANAITLREDNHLYASVIGFVPGQPAPTPAGTGIVILGDNNIVGTNGDGVNDANEHNVISGRKDGIIVWGGNNRIANNYIGTNIAGTGAIPNGSAAITPSGGIRVVGPDNGTVIGTNVDGTSDVLERNVISGNNGTAVSFGADAGNGTVRGNFIGVNAAGTSPLPNGDGIDIDTNNIVIGGTAPVAGNVIAHSPRPALFPTKLGMGVSVGQDQTRTPVGVIIRGNSIFGNEQGNLGMRGGGGANDALDADVGVNGIQNYPTLFAQTNQAGGTTIEGTLASKPNESYDIDFYKNATCGSQDLVQFRGLETYLGSVTVQTDAAGSADIVADLPLTPYAPIVATATGPEGTSVHTRCLGARLQLSGDEGDLGLTAQVGEDFTYSLQVSNGGPAVAPGSVVTFPLPPGVLALSTSTPQGTCEIEPGLVTCDLGTLEPSTNLVIDIDAVGTQAGNFHMLADVNTDDAYDILDAQKTMYDTVIKGTSCTIVGGPATETITGTSGDDVLCGLGGIDTINGRGGKDTLYGGTNADILDGGGGADVIFGGIGDDLATFDSSAASVDANLDTGLASGAGADKLRDVEDLFGSPFADKLTGNGGGNELFGGGKGDKLFGLAGADKLSGGGGDDTLNGGAGQDNCLQGPGTGPKTACE